MSATGMAIAVILFILGILGTFMPALPGSPLIWLGMLLYGFFTEFQGFSLTFYLGQAVAVLATMIVDYTATAYGTKKYGGSPAAVWGGILGVIIGPFVLGPLGFVIGPFLGAFALEVLTGRQTEKAFQAAFGTLVGLLGGTILKLTIAAVMIIWFFWVAIPG